MKQAVMNKELTLSLNESAIKNAKIFAKTNNTSLSKLIEGYLRPIVDKKHVALHATLPHQAPKHKP